MGTIRVLMLLLYSANHKHLDDSDVVGFPLNRNKQRLLGMILWHTSITSIILLHWRNRTERSFRAVRIYSFASCGHTASEENPVAHWITYQFPLNRDNSIYIYVLFFPSSVLVLALIRIGVSVSSVIVRPLFLISGNMYGIHYSTGPSSLAFCPHDAKL